MQSKLNYRRTFLIGLAFLSISAFWTLYDNIVPLILQETFGLGETVTGTVMAMDNVLAVFLLPLFGSLSDKVDTRFGKRMPFIVGGTVLASIFIMMMPMADRGENFVWFVIALFAALLAMGTYRSPAVALMPDLTPNSLRSKANAIINLMGAVGGVYTLIMIRILVGGGKRPDYLPLFVSVVALMVITVGILMITIKENVLKKKLAIELNEDAGKTESEPAPQVASEEKETDRADTEVKTKEKQPVKTVLAPEVKRSMYFMLASIFFWFTAYNAVTTAFSRYTKVVWKMEGGGFADCLMVATVAAIISYIPIGHIAAKIGRKKTIMGGVLLMTACYGTAVLAGTYHPAINIVFALIGMAWAAINVNSYPMIVAMSKGSDIGKFTGTYYTFSMAAQIFTPILSGFLLENISYRVLFPYAVVFSALAFLTMTQVRHGDVKPEKKASMLENFDIED